MKGTRAAKQKPITAKSPEDQVKQKKPEGDKSEVPEWRKGKKDKKGKNNEEETGQGLRTELPFRNVPPVEFSDRQNEPNIGAQHDPIAEIASGVAYKLKAPIDEIKDASIKAIIETIKSVTIGIPLKDLIAAAPEVQKETKNLVTKKRVPVQEKEGVNLQGKHCRG
jgi:hypothetical protein